VLSRPSFFDLVLWVRTADLMLGPADHNLSRFKWRRTVSVSTRMLVFSAMKSAKRCSVHKEKGNPRLRGRCRTTRISSSRYVSVTFAGDPSRGRAAKPSTPSAKYRLSQFGTVCSLSRTMSQSPRLSTAFQSITTRSGPESAAVHPVCFDIVHPTSFSLHW
jgi:hypothetical protein